MEIELSYPHLRAYTKKELALMYMPNSSPLSAEKTLMSWINRNIFLAEGLAKLGYNKYRHTFFAREVALIFEHLGPP